MEINVNESASLQSNRFMADLTQAMRATAETAQLASIEQSRVDAKAYIEQLKAQTNDGTGTLHQAAEADVATIRERSKAAIERVRTETEQRCARRRELLQQELQEFNSAVDLEIQSVQDRVTAFQNEVTSFFDQLLQGADPTVFASMASQMPDPPDFVDLDSENLADELRARREHLARADAVEAAPAAQSVAPAAQSVAPAAQPAQAAQPAPPAHRDAPKAKGETGGVRSDEWWMNAPDSLAAETAARIAQERAREMELEGWTPERSRGDGTALDTPEPTNGQR